MKAYILGGLMVCGLALGVGNAVAHHSFTAEFDSNKPVTIALPFMMQDTRACGPLEAKLVYTLPRPRGDGAPKANAGSLVARALRRRHKS